MSVLVDLVGWAGAAALLVGYVLVSARRLEASSGRFQALNLVGAAGLAANGTYHGAWPSVALNLVWLLVGAVALVRRPPAALGTRGPAPEPVTGTVAVAEAVPGPVRE